jgi:hypothetical protein
MANIAGICHRERGSIFGTDSRQIKTGKSDTLILREILSGDPDHESNSMLNANEVNRKAPSAFDAYRPSVSAVDATSHPRSEFQKGCIQYAVFAIILVGTALYAVLLFDFNRIKPLPYVFDVLAKGIFRRAEQFEERWYVLVPLFVFSAMCIAVAKRSKRWTMRLGIVTLCVHVLACACMYWNLNLHVHPDHDDVFIIGLVWFCFATYLGLVACNRPRLWSRTNLPLPD